MQATEKINFMKNDGKITTKSLAKQMGISHTTVSNAWNNPEKLSEELREKIFARAQEVGFQGPDKLARALRTGQADAIGVIFNDPMSYVFIDRHDINLMRGIAMECEKQRTNLVLIPLNGEKENHTAPVTTLVDGYILNATYNNERVIQQAFGRRIPIVTLDFSLPWYSSVSIDNSRAMRDLCLYLVEKGHRHFGIIAFPSSTAAAGESRLSEPRCGDNDLMLTRVNACQETLFTQGIPLEQCWLYETQHDEENGARAAGALLSAHPEITALICLSDRFAAGAIQYCLDHHIAIPQQMAVTGFDNTLPEVQGIGLTTIAQDAVKKDQLAAQILLQKGPVTHCELEYELISRASA